MGFREVTQAVRHEAARRAKDVGVQVEPKIRNATPDQGETASAALRASREKLGEAATSVRSARDRAVARAARTRVGNAVGTRTGRVGRHVQDIPILSLPRAVIDERRGVAQLTRLVVARPADPLPALWLAGALQLLDRDLRVYLGLRTFWNPYALLFAESTKLAAALGHGRLVRPADEMLRRAYSLAVLRLRGDRDDAEALHVVARVFHATGQYAGGLKPCTFAVAFSGSALTRAQALYTLSRLQRRSGDAAAARSSAVRAVDHGCSLGWQVLAELMAEEDAGTSTERIARYQQMVARIEPDHELAYRGFLPPKSGDLWRAVLHDQSGRAENSYRWLAENFEKVQTRTGDAIRKRAGRSAEQPSADPPALLRVDEDAGEEGH